MSNYIQFKLTNTSSSRTHHLAAGPWILIRQSFTLEQWNYATAAAGDAPMTRTLGRGAGEPIPFGTGPFNGR